MDGNRVALLIDWENIKFSHEQSFGSPPDIITFKKLARRYGKLSVARSYANWADTVHEGEMERFSHQGIEPVYVQTRAFTECENKIVKGSSDIKMACDAIELLARNPELSVYILASGDGGFAHILNKLKEYGKTVVSVGVRNSIGGGLSVVSDELIIYDDLVSGLRIVSENRDVLQALTGFQWAVEDIRKTKGDNTLQGIKKRMQERNPDFEEEGIGISSFRCLAYLAELKDYVNIDSASEPARAYLFNEYSTEDGRPVYPGAKWKLFLEKLSPNTGYTRKTLVDLVKSGIFPDEAEAGKFIYNAIGSRVLWAKRQQYYVSESAGVKSGTQYFLNLNHPKVFVYRTAASQTGQDAAQKLKS